MIEQDVFTLSWHIVLTAEEVKTIVPEYQKDGEGPYLIVFMGDKGTMIWNYTIMLDVYSVYKQALDAMSSNITPTA